MAKAVHTSLNCGVGKALRAAHSGEVCLFCSIASSVKREKVTMKTNY